MFWALGPGRSKKNTTGKEGSFLFIKNLKKSILVLPLQWLIETNDLFLKPEDVETILTTRDLSVYLKDMVQKDDRKLNIDIDYESGELFINCPGFSDGLLVKTDPFGVWVISELISGANDGIFIRSGNLHKTERAVTVLWAVASWIVDLEESTKNT